MATNPTPNMNLPVPVIGVEPGPQWASDVNSCFTAVDQHNHSSGSGVQITPSGINLNADLTLNNNNLTSIRSSRYTSQGSTLSNPNDLNCTYVSGVDLYYNDGNGNQVRMTQSGNVAGTPGSISNLTSPASASYNSVSETFVWQSAANTPANLDAGSVIFRDIVANSNGVTVNPPNPIPSNYSLTLPSLPASQKFMTLDAAGNMSAPWAVDNSTIEVNSNTVQVKASGITTTQISSQAVEQNNLYIRTANSSTASAGNVAISSSCGSFTTTAGDNNPQLVTNLSVTLTTTGRPVIIKIIPDINSSSSGEGSRINDDTAGGMAIRIKRDASFISVFTLSGDGSGTAYWSPFDTLDVPSAGSHTYSVYVNTNISGNAAIFNMRLMAYEI